MKSRSSKEMECWSVQEENNLRNFGLILISKGIITRIFDKIQRVAFGIKF